MKDDSFPEKERVTCEICKKAFENTWFARIYRDGQHLALCSPKCVLLYLNNPSHLSAEGQAVQERQADEPVVFAGWYDLAAGMDIVTGGLELVV